MIATEKLESVPIITYSVIFISCSSFRSPYLNIDLAARRNPMASKFPVNINVINSSCYL